MREPSQILHFQHRFHSGMLCSIDINLEEARTGSLRPNFVWNGPRPKTREFIAWGTHVFSTLAARVGKTILYCYVHSNGQTETWIHEPNFRPRRIRREHEPCRNIVSALTVALVSTPTIDTQGGG